MTISPARTPPLHPAATAPATRARLASVTTTLLFATAMLASTPANAVAGVYAFVGGGVGPSLRELGTPTVQPTLRVGPSVDFGGEAGLFHLSGSADVRFLFGPFDGATEAPLDLDLLVNIGVVVPIPLVQPFFRFRAGPGWAFFVAGADAAIVLGIEGGVRVRAPGAPAALVLSFAPTARIPPSGPEHSALHIELRAGVCFP